MSRQADLLAGTQDLMRLEPVSPGDPQGCGVLLRIGGISEGSVLVPQGAPYPALYRHRKRRDPRGGSGCLAEAIARSVLARPEEA